MYDELIKELLPIIRTIKVNQNELSSLVFQEVGNDLYLSIEVNLPNGRRSATIYLQKAELFMKNKESNINEVNQAVTRYNNNN